MNVNLDSSLILDSAFAASAACERLALACVCPSILFPKYSTTTYMRKYGTWTQD